MSDLRTQVTKYLTDAHGLEQQSLRSLQASAKNADDPQLKQAFEFHARETEGHLTRIERLLEARGEKPSKTKDVGNAAISAGKGVLDVVRKDNAGKELRDAYIGEAVEIISYELLKATATKAGEPQVAEEADAILAEERAAQERLTGLVDLAVDRSLQVEGATS